MKFEELNISKDVLRALDEMGYEETTPIQLQTIPLIIGGEDVIGQSQTGTGKTASYGLPMIEKIDPNSNKVQAIILCPTRELAIQVTDEIRKFTKYTFGIKTLAVYGGESIERQIQMLKKGVKIVVGTPGRVMDHMRRKTLKLDNVNMVVLDEADEMLNYGFEEDIKTILDEVPEERQTVLFSATMNERILKIAKKYLKEPKKVKIEAKELTVDKIEQVMFEVKNPIKDEVLMRLVDFDNPKKVVVFCNTKRKVDNVIEVLKKNGYKAEALHGDIKQSQRDRIIRRFKDGEFQILVATDVVARGIDVDELELVINYDVPQEEEYYVHRIGRTGRNGKFGKAYTFVVGREKSKLNQIKKYANTNIKLGKIPTIKDVKEQNSAKVVSKIREEILKVKDVDFTINQILDELKEMASCEDIAKALLNMTMSNSLINQNKVTVVSDNDDYSERRNYKRERSSKNENGFEDELDEAFEERRCKKAKNSKGRMKVNSGNQKLFLSLGKKDNIMAKDIIGAIASNCVVSGSELGKINIMDKFSFVEVPEEYIDDILVGMKGKTIKNKKVNLEIAKS